MAFLHLFVGIKCLRLDCLFPFISPDLLVFSLIYILSGMVGTVISAVRVCRKLKICSNSVLK